MNTIIENNRMSDQEIGQMEQMIHDVTVSWSILRESEGISLEDPTDEINSYRTDKKDQELPQFGLFVNESQVSHLRNMYKAYITFDMPNKHLSKNELQLIFASYAA